MRPSVPWLRRWRVWTSSSVGHVRRDALWGTGGGHHCRRDGKWETNVVAKKAGFGVPVGRLLKSPQTIWDEFERAGFLQSRYGQIQRNTVLLSVPHLYPLKMK